MLASSRGETKYVLISLNTSAAAMSICCGNVLHRLSIVPLNKGGVAGSLAYLRLRSTSTRGVGLGCTGTCASVDGVSPALGCSISGSEAVRDGGFVRVMRTHMRRVMRGT